MGKKCPTCQGKGVIRCSACNGTGKRGNALTGFSDCSRCSGLGEHKCPNCRGSGEVG